MSPHDPEVPDELKAPDLETLLNLDAQEAPRPGFDTRFFARLEEEKLSARGGFWQSFRRYFWTSALAIAAVTVLAVYWKAAPSSRNAARGSTPSAAVTPLPPSVNMPSPAAEPPTTVATESADEAEDTEMDLTVDLELAEELDVVEQLDQVEGVELLAQLDSANVDERELEQLLAEVATP